MAGKRVQDVSLGLRIRPRIYRGGDIALGPGKVDLLEAIAATGSITRAAGQLGMSYMRAWTLVKTMNRCFEAPLVLASRGGQHGGRAQLTRNGREVLALYHRLTAESLRASRPFWQRIRRRMKS